MTWREITERLNAEPYSVGGLTLQAIHSFFAAASKREAPPLGFDSLPGQPATQPAPAQPVAPQHAKKEKPLYQPEPEKHDDPFAI
jgi:hypothetical protein